ncbi:DNA -binding domain-containing protein [Caulobacter sp. RHG1]|uniref:DNA -binding domain-containing protein n=1 Tax=Caulobacter sp. (strain RHG1) TaxID=2545762 RepID=UPI0015533E19|nr:DUF2285 domain-containing protein [Caulobacter sp. RHG1]NQE65556.1 hypothetical protein [Caulobacter sp. RHG1]
MPATIGDTAPDSATLTDYDRQHLKTYLRLLDADAAGADWREVAAIVLGLDPEADPAAAQARHASHLARARWLIAGGYRDLLKPD